jgi:hypothetical protein
MNGEIADGEDDDDNDQHLGRFPPGTQLQFDRSVGIDGEHILVAAGTTGTVAAGPSMVAVVVVMIVARLLGEETNCAATYCPAKKKEKKKKDKSAITVNFRVLI